MDIIIFNGKTRNKVCLKQNAKIGTRDRVGNRQVM